MTSETKRPYKPSPAAIRMLENMVNGRSLTHGLSGRSEHGGASKTWIALHRHGLRDGDEITRDGMRVLEEARASQR